MKQTTMIAAGILILILVSFAAGRYSASKPEVKQTTVSDDTVKQTENKDTHTVTTSKTIEQPSGVKEVDVTITTDIVSHRNEVQTDDSMTKTDIIPPKTNTVNLSALVGFQGFFTPVYGASISKQLFGPVTIGGFGLTNGTFGVSLGLNF